MTLAGILLAAIVQIYQTAYRAEERGSEVTIALLEAESKLAEIGVTVPLRPGQASGELPSGHRWLAEISVYTGIEKKIRDQLPVEGFNVSLTILGRNNAKLSTLNTMRLAPRRRDE